ncbi:MAG: acetylxylan esterase [Bryobacteraceae bacterium]
MRAWLYLAPAAMLLAQAPATKYDEASVPAYTLPALVGPNVPDAKAWEARRRPEIFRLLEMQMFGRVPETTPKVETGVASVDKHALEGKAVRKQVTLTMNGKPVHLLIYLPAKTHGPVPVFVGLNFPGNHTINKDPGIVLPDTWDRKPKKQPGTDAQRGSAASRWPVEKILDRGYGLATAYYEEIEPDFDGGIEYGIRAGTKPAAGEWSAIAVWAWGLSRIADYLLTDNDIDPKRLILMGHSRLGKTALWACAADKRFAMVISNDSGEGGAALSRREIGERVGDLNRRFPHWFCANYKQYSEHESEMPFDSHMLLALVAPRSLYVASAGEDQWADPRGEFLGALSASVAWAFYGKKGIGTDRMPDIHQPVGEYVRYHVRAGKHDVTDYDWEQYLDFANQKLSAKH